MEDVFSKIGCVNQEVLAVRLNCVGDKFVGGRPSYESVHENTDFLSPESKRPIPIATHRKINCYIDILNPPQQELGIGSVIVARRDGKPLLPTHMLALACYATESLKDPNLPKNACITPHMLNIERIGLLPKDGFHR
ncbi:hypothetical protein T440DRAFT_522056 [Plenodomus tracheiphilus IPT5]|uniref:Uncharacterized protein n=1 Tax=Plenodomus tracheiphilus IPT5 TaxID=1408161 RepID=A0A6A7AS41_9PLEO|nr:hypothetical protein T440DRAFT_522056 [Plenodomus tracheiphilus IPT5]